MYMEAVPQWSVSIDFPGMGRTTWTVNGIDQLKALVEILAWNNASRFEVSRTSLREQLGE